MAIFGLISEVGKLVQRLRRRSETTRLSQASTELFRTLQPGDVAIDCGANVGLVSSKMAARGAIVYAFEPNPHAFRVLQARFANDKNVHLFPKAVHAENGHMKLFLHCNAAADQVAWSTGSSMLASKPNVNASTFVEVEVVDIVDFIARLDRRVRIMKLDVEGVECPIVNKLIDTGVVHKIDRLVVETHDDKIPSLRTETDALRQRIANAGLTHVSLDWI